METLNFKIFKNIFFSVLMLISAIYIVLYHININKLKEHHSEKLENVICLLDNEQKTFKEDTLKNLANSNPYIKSIKYENKVISGVNSSDKTFFEQIVLFKGKEIVVSYSNKLKINELQFFVIKFFMVVISLFLILLVVFLKISNLLKPFDEINKFFKEFKIGSSSLLEYKSQNISKEFELLKESINHMSLKVHESSNKIYEMAYTDKLTGLPNREAYYREVEKRINDVSFFSILFMDLNGFKVINDRYGHKLGDLFLSKIADKLYHFDIFRLGADEFVIIVNSIHKDYINAVCQEIIRIGNEDVIIDDIILSVGARIGISVLNEKNMHADILLTEANIALYKSKEIGKNIYTYFSYDMYQAIEDRMNLLHDIKVGVKKKEFTFFIQPQVRISDKKIIGGEALLRWNKNGELIPPEIFIKELENNPCIIDVGNQLIEDVMIYTNKLNQDGIEFGKISINLAERQINEDNFIKNIETILDKTKANPKNIEFEITERWNSINKKEIMDNICVLKELGFSISLDDFGEDKSSFNRTDLLPIDTLKLDKKFVERLFQETSSVNSVKSILTYANLSKINFIAEGVETQDELKKLEEIGVEYVQGYLFYKPLTQDEFIKVFN